MIRVTSGEAHIACVCGRVVVVPSNTVEVPTPGPTRKIGLGDVSAVQFTAALRDVVEGAVRHYYRDVLVEMMRSEFRQYLIDLVADLKDDDK